MTLFKPGDIIHDFEEPAIKYLNFEFRDRYCNNCFKGSESLIRKSCECNLVYYCSKECSDNDMEKIHKLECGLYKELNTDDDNVGKIIKIMCYHKLNQDVVANNAKRTARLYDGTKRCFNDQNDNYHHFRKIKKVRTLVKGLAAKLRRLGAFSEADLDLHNLYRMYGLWQVNGFDIPNEYDLRTMGVILYVAASTFDHSCRPNAVRVFDAKFRVQIRCISSIIIGGRPCITYDSGIRTKSQRANKLTPRYNFACNCELCEYEKHFGERINYKELNNRIIKLRRKGDHAYEELQTAEAIIRDLEIAYSPYDERVTDFYLEVLTRQFITFLSLSAQRKSPIMMIKDFASRVEDRMRITYGTDHKNYRFLAKKISCKLGIVCRRNSLD